MIVFCIIINKMFLSCFRFYPFKSSRTRLYLKLFAEMCWLKEKFLANWTLDPSLGGSFLVEEENKWRLLWQISKNGNLGSTTFKFPKVFLYFELDQFLTSEASSSSIPLSFVVVVLLPSCCCFWGRSVELQSSPKSTKRVNSGLNVGALQWDKNEPHGQSGWMYGGLRSGCMECTAAGGCLPLERPRTQVYTLRPGPVATTSSIQG